MTFNTVEFDGFPGGMNLAFPKQAINDLECRYAQDVLLDYPSRVRRRGPVAPVPNLGALTNKAVGIAGTLDPTGIFRVAALTGNNTNGFFSVYSDSLSSKTDIAWPTALQVTPPTYPFSLVDTSPGLTSGLYIGTSDFYADTANQCLAIWRGANLPNYSNGNVTVARGSTAVTGGATSWAANAASGMFLFANTDDPYTSTYIGVVASVGGNTSLTLSSPSPFACTTKAYTLRALRGFQPLATVGRITFATDSTTVTGGATKFKTQLSPGTWHLYRAVDWTFIGKVTSIETNTSLTLTANAAIAGYNERFIGVRADGNWDIACSTGAAADYKVGFLTDTYAERQWFANNGSQFSKTYRLWYSESGSPEMVDLTPFDGSFFDIGDTSGANSPIKKIAGAYNGLLVFKENETFIVTGSSTSTFSPRKLWDDGCFSGMSVQKYAGGVIWAGVDGIHFYDGTTVTNMTDLKLGNYYKNAIRNVDPNVTRMYSMLSRDHYFLFIEDFDPEVAVYKGTVTDTPSSAVIVINLLTQAVSMMTNVNLRGAIELPADTGLRSWYVCNTSTIGKICDINFLFDFTGTDTVTCDGGTAGPDLYVESKAYDFGESARMKKVIRLLMNYLTSGDSLRVDLVLGLGEAGRTLTEELPSTTYTWDGLGAAYATWNILSGTYPAWDSMTTSNRAAKRLFFDRRSSHIAFRIWQDSANVTDAEFNIFQWAFKPMRKGRIA